MVYQKQIVEERREFVIDISPGPGIIKKPNRFKNLRNINLIRKTPLAFSRRHIIYLVLGLGAAVALGVSAGFFFALTRDIPQIQSLETFKPDAITRIYSADEVLLAERFIEKRQPVPLAVMPTYLKQAILATEDVKFYEHPGVDPKGILRAVVRNVVAGEYVEGASTITQQLAKTLFLTPRKSIFRKLKEAFLSFQIERRYTKDEILELYLNQVYFGSGAYGVEEAAQIFFGKPVQDLTLDECALIAGMPKSPSRYSPLINETLAVNRRNGVLQQMQREGIITKKQLAAAKETPLLLADPKVPTGFKAPYFVADVMGSLEDILGETALYRTGLTVYTTLNFALQQQAERAVARGLDRLNERMKARKLPEDDPPQAALVCLDVSRGAILAMVGGRAYKESRFNRATMARRQPGSAFKPVIYALAIEKGYAQNDMLWDAPVVFKGASRGWDWSPKNFSGKYMGEMTLRKALALSKNIPAVKLLDKLGPSTAVQFAYRMGITSPLDPNLSLVLGTSETTLLELTAAYGAFPNKGVWTKPFGAIEVLDREGRALWTEKLQRHSVTSPETAAVMTDMLRAVVLEGTGRKARKIGRPLAGKTGTTDSYKDALFVGFSPTIATGVWVGLDRHGTLGDKETGARAALPIWIDFMEFALKGRPYYGFDNPEGVVTVSMDPESGLLASEHCPDAVSTVFKKGTEPKKYCKAEGTGLESLRE
jgi:penicillin-binding protein 1A